MPNEEVCRRANAEAISEQVDGGVDSLHLDNSCHAGVSLTWGPGERCLCPGIMDKDIGQRMWNDGFQILGGGGIEGSRQGSLEEHNFRP